MAQMKEYQVGQLGWEKMFDVIAETIEFLDDSSSAAANDFYHIHNDMVVSNDAINQVIKSTSQFERT